MKAKMRNALLWLPLLFLGLLQPTNAKCILEDGNTVSCPNLEDAKHIATYNVTSLKAHVEQRKLTATLLKNLDGLRNLDLSQGELRELETGVFKKMSTLRNLNLADNNIENLQLTDFDGLNELRSIDLRGNNIQQLPAALIRLESLKVLEISGNALNCNCATLKVRDLLLRRGVKISKSVYCGTPSSWRGTTLLELEAEAVCLAEEQDDEMQGDQPFDFQGSGSGTLEGSGDLGSGEFPPFEIDDDEFFGNHETPAPEIAETETPHPIEIVHDDIIKSVNNASEGVSISRRIILDGNAADETITEYQNKNTDITATSTASTTTEFIVPVLSPSEPTEDSNDSSHALTPETDQDNNEPGGTDSDLEFVEGSKENTSEAKEDDLTSSSFWDWLVTDSSKTSPKYDELTVVDSTTTTTESPIDVNDTIPNSAVTTPSETSNTEETSEDASVSNSAIDTIRGTSVTTSNPENSTVAGDGGLRNSKNANNTVPEPGVASATESKTGMSSYIVLGALGFILVGLIGYAALKNNFCKNKRKPNDVEGGTELRDMQKSLLDGTNSTQPKISSNGNSENAPLVITPDRSWGEPGNSKPWQEANTPTVDDQLKRSTQTSEQDPVKPPRKSLPPQEELNEVTLEPTIVNGVNTPPNSPISYVNGSNSPPLSPNAQRVKITLQDNVDSVPKTPILITRTKAGENLVKTQ